MAGNYIKLIYLEELKKILTLPQYIYNIIFRSNMKFALQL